MQVAILSVPPPEWKDKKPIETYETRFLYLGFSRYDTAKETLSNFYRDEDSGVIQYTERPHPEACFSRCYAAEHVRVTIYSLSPRVWKEEADAVHFFVQQPQQTA